MAKLMVSSNDREFICKGVNNTNSSQFETAAASASSSSSDPNSHSSILRSFDINAKQLLDTTAIRNSLVTCSNDMDRAYKNLLTWIDAMQLEFEMKVNTNKIPLNISLFYKINNVLAKIKQNKKILNAWLLDFKELISETYSVLDDYDLAVTLIDSVEMSSMPTSGGGGLSMDNIALARKNYSKSTSIRRQLNKIITMSNLLRTKMSTIQNKINSFHNGIITHEGKMLNMQIFEDLLKELGGDESSLSRLQQILAEKIIKNPQNLAFPKIEVKPLVMPSAAAADNAANFNFSSTKYTNILPNYIQHLELLKREILFTESTREKIEKMFEAINKVASGTPYEEVIENLEQSVRNNIPNNVINEIRGQMRQDNMIFELRERVNKIIQNLSDEDNIYLSNFKDLLTEIESEATLRFNNEYGATNSNVKIDPSGTARTEEEAEEEEEEEREGISTLVPLINIDEPMNIST